MAMRSSPRDGDNRASMRINDMQRLQTDMIRTHFDLPLYKSLAADIFVEFALENEKPWAIGSLKVHQVRYNTGGCGRWAKSISKKWQNIVNLMRVRSIYKGLSIGAKDNESPA